LGRSIAFFIGERGEKKRKLEEQYIQHSNALVNLVFEKWLASSDGLEDNPLFLNACEHLDSGYHDLWAAWFGDKGYKQLSSDCDQLLENLKKQIENKIEGEIATEFSYVFQGNQFEVLVTDVYDYVQRKIETGHDLFHFEIETKENQSFIVSRRNDMKDYYRDFRYLAMSSRSDLEKVKLILNSILANSELVDMMRYWRLTAIERNKKLEQFREGLKYVISTARYGFKGIDGKCSGKYGCKDWKP
jgi:hypothetical protein